MLLIWYIYDNIPSIYLWYTLYIPLIYTWYTLEIPLIYPWYTLDIPLIYPWYSLMNHQWCYAQDLTIVAFLDSPVLLRLIQSICFSIHLFLSVFICQNIPLFVFVKTPSTFAFPNLCVSPFAKSIKLCLESGMLCLFRSHSCKISTIVSFWNFSQRW